MIQQYIDQKINRKNRSIYFKKGKWIIHVFIIITIFLLNNKELKTNATIFESFVFSAILSIPFLSFFYFYCLYLIPVLFKRNFYRKFWILFIASLAILPLIQYLIHYGIMVSFPQFATSLKAKSLPKLYDELISLFSGFTATLFIMELAEGIRTGKETLLHDNDLQKTEQKLLKSNFGSGFILNSLDGLIKLSASKSDRSPESVILFSDILRYRLYRGAELFVPLEEECENLKKLFHFYNLIAGKSICDLELTGNIEGKKISTLCFINMAEQLLNTYKEGLDWSLYMYLNMEDEDLQIAIELNSSEPVNAAIESVEKNLKTLFGEQHTFAVETNESLNSIRICLQIIPVSIALL